MIAIIFLPLVIGFLISFLLTPLTITLAKRYHFVDDPKKHKHPAVIHMVPTPRAGGLPMYFAILIGSLLLFYPLNRIFSSLLFAGFFVVFVGIIDDKYDLSPYVRFIGNIVCASIVVLTGANMPFITNPFGGILNFKGMDIVLFGISVPFLPEILAIFWIVWIMNMLNWSKGVDGQMPGVAVVSAVIIGLASLRFQVLDSMNIATSQMSFLTAGAALGFLVFNFYPAKIFPGYSATILGFTIGVLSIVSSVKLATAVLVMAIPMTDAVITIVRRIVSKKSPFWHDKGHLHHLLLRVGLGQRVIAVFYWIMSAALGILSLSLSSRGKLFAIILVVIIVSGFILTLKLLIKKNTL